MKRPLLLLVFLGVFIQGVLFGQTKYYYSVDNNPASGNCNVIPFGTGGTGSWENQRCQLLVKSAKLPLGRPGMVRSVGFAFCSSGLRKFKGVIIKLGHNKTNTLVSSFAANFSGPVFTVFNRADVNWNITANTWTRLPLSRPFIYNGKDALVVDVYALGSGQGGSRACRRGTEPRCYKVGLNLVAGVSSYGKGCLGSNGKVPLVSPVSFPILGSNLFNIGVKDAAGSVPAVLLTGNSNTVFGPIKLPFDLTGLGAPGCSLLTRILFFTALTTDGKGNALAALSLPADPSLHGAKAYFQWILLDRGANAAGLVTTGGVGMTLGNVGPSSGSLGNAGIKVELGIL